MECVAPPHLNPSVTSRCVSLRPSMYADVRCIDDVIAIEGPVVNGISLEDPGFGPAQHLVSQS